MQSNSTITESIPNSCPGTQSATAGKVSSCEGCPNQKLCSSGQANIPDPAVEQIKERLRNVKHKILILSGKGGVGKSTFSAQLTHTLASDPEIQVALVDIDICGPSVPVIMGVEGHQIHQSASGWSPVLVEDNISVMSVGFMLDGPEAAVIWRGPKKTGIIKKFLLEVDWGEQDYMLFDTPPGTSDEHMAVVQYLNGSCVDGAVIITTPQEVSLVDVRKEINFCKKMGVPVIGVVQNMSGFVCPNCLKSTDIFVANTGGAVKMCEEMNVPYLGSIPLDTSLARCSDEGKSLLSCGLVDSGSPTLKSLTDIANKIRDFCESKD